MKRVVRTFLKNNEGKYLFVKHHKKGNWVLPGWHIEKWETIYKAIKREIKEELNLEIKILWDKIWLENTENLKEKPLPISIYKLNYENRDGKKIEKMEYIFLSEIKNWEIKTQDSEIYEYIFLSKEEVLENSNIYEQTKEILKKTL